MNIDLTKVPLPLGQHTLHHNPLTLSKRPAQQHTLKLTSN